MPHSKQKVLQDSKTLANQLVCPWEILEAVYQVQSKT